MVNSLGVVLDGRLAQQQQQQRPRTDTKTQTVAGKVAQRKHDHHKVKQYLLQYALTVLRFRDVFTGSEYFPSRIHVEVL